MELSFTADTDLLLWQAAPCVVIPRQAPAKSEIYYISRLIDWTPIKE
jgi:hypothetical protein